MPYIYAKSNFSANKLLTHGSRYHQDTKDQAKTTFRKLNAKPVADGLGHGEEAHFAVQKAIEAFIDHAETSASDTIRFLHERVRKTRGFVGLVVFYSKTTAQWRVSGVGNIAARWTGLNDSRNHVSYNGIIGYNIPGTMNDQVLSGEDYNQFIACSDDIRSRWDLTKFPGVGHHDGMIIASAIYKEFARGNDDASVIVCKSV